MQFTIHVAFFATLVLNEVLYDPPGPDGGHEFVELLNTGDVPVRLDNLEIQVGDGARPGVWRTAWRSSGEEIRPWAPFVVGGDSVAAGVGLLEVSLQNGPDAVRLWRPGEVVDLLGYGDLTDAGLFESRPAADVSGASLARLPDGRDRDDNALDWSGAEPSPGRRNLPRREWRLRMLPSDPTRLWPYRTLAVRALVRNRGRDALESNAWSVAAGLRRLHGEPYLDGMVPEAREALTVPFVAPGLAAGDSVEFEVRWFAQKGLFQLDVAARGVDEDSTDNHDAAVLRVGSGDVVINELLFAPDPGQFEWIELHNRGTRSHDLVGWTLADATGKPARLRASRPLVPGGFAVLSADTLSELALAASVVRVAVSPWPSLNNSDAADGVADRVVLRDPLGFVQDAIFYRAAWGVARGRSIERLTLDADARGLLWAPSKEPNGDTAGRANSASAPQAHVGLRLHPNPFSPDADGVDDLLAAGFEVPQGALGFEASIFDVDGHRRRWLAADRLGPGPRRLVWDGTDDRGIGLIEGVYIFRLEFLGMYDPAVSTMQCVGLVRGRSPRARAHTSPR